MAQLEQEITFVSVFYRMLLDGDPTGEALRIAKHMRPKEGDPVPMFESPKEGRAFAWLADRWCAGDFVPDEAHVFALGRHLGDMDHAAALHRSARASDALKVGPYARNVLDSWRVRRQIAHASDTVAEARILLRENPTRALDFVQRNAYRMAAMAAETAVGRTPHTRAEFAKQSRARTAVQGEGTRGYRWPWPKMFRRMGYIIPGRAYGLTAPPEKGKSTWAANVAVGLTRQDAPCIISAPEMGTDFLERAYAAEAGIPQRVAEEGLWDWQDPELLEHLAETWGLFVEGVTKREALAVAEGMLRDYLASYLRTVEAWQTRPYELIADPEQELEETLSRMGVLRRRFSGRQVVYLFDHLYAYACADMSKIDMMAGPWARRIREFIRADTDGGASAIILLQPKKAPTIKEAQVRAFMPTPPSEVRGQVEQVLDVHIAMYLRHVQVDENKRTPWGSLLALRDENGNAITCAYNAKTPKKINDEDVYLKRNKGRNKDGRADSDSTFSLKFNPVTGAITEEIPPRQLELMRGEAA